MSRPEIPIDWERVDELLLCGSPGSEVAAHFGMHPDTFYKRVESKYGVGFSAYLAQKRSTGEALIRKAQFEKALGISKKGDNTLLIWLGKQRLNQRENAVEGQTTEELTGKYLDVIKQLNDLQSSKASVQG